VSEAQVISTQPSNGATGISIATTVIARFDIDMKASTVTSNNFILKSGSVEINGTVVYDAIDRTATFTPSASLEHLTEYTAKITTGICDCEGKTLADEVEWKFTTMAEGTVSAPEFSPVQGVFENDLVVTLSCSTVDATIYYTMTSGTLASPPADPVVPTSGSTPYATGIAVSGQDTVIKIKAIAVKGAMTNSAISFGQFTIDNTAFAAKWGTAIWGRHKWNP